MLTKTANHTFSAPIVRKISDFRSREEGGVTIFVIFIFVLMILFGGIAVDVMRYEWRRVTLQETMDRAMLAAANLVIPPNQTPQSVAQSWFDVAGLGDELTVDYSAPTITGESTSSSRRVVGTARVRSYNHFMHMMDYPFFEAPVSSGAEQGVSKIEVIMALDITGSMAEASGTTTKIAALRTAATNFVNILKFNRDANGNPTTTKDPNNLISIGMVPYSSNVNIPVALRNQFTVAHLSSWNNQPLQGVPDINCIELPASSFGSTALSRTTPIPMAAVAQIGGSAPGGLNYVSVTGNTTGGRITLNYTAPIATDTNDPQGNQLGPFMCNHGDNPSTGANERGSNLVRMPSGDITALRNQIAQLNPRGNTSIAMGMRWATALIDESARPIYSALVGTEPGMAGRPANNNDPETRKIIVLMTDGTHVSSRYILDPYKSGPSPIYRGDTDGRLAIRFTSGGNYFTNGTRPGISATNTCSGWQLALNREFFVPHLKASSVRQRVGTQAEGAGSGTSISGACDPLAWLAAGTGGVPSWTGSGVVRQLDWSEVWRYASVDWVIEQLYMRSNVSGTNNYTTIKDAMVGNYLTSEANMDALLNTNCTAAKQAGVEVFGIVLGNNVTPGPIRNCSSPGVGYFYQVTNPTDLNAAFEQIAVLISPLRLTQ